jgi:hypothetical protein
MTAPVRKRLSRATLALLAVLFLAPFVVALVLNRLGWHPAGTRNHGELVQPPQPVAVAELVDRDGDALALANMDHRFTLLVRLPAACDPACAARLDELHRIRQSLGRHAPRLAIRLLAPAVLPPLPADLQALDDASVTALEADSSLLAQAPDWSGLLIDDKAYLMLRFPPDLEARLVRRDLSRLIR